MSCCDLSRLSAIKRLLAGAVTLAIFAAILLIAGLPGSEREKVNAGGIKVSQQDWVMYGGSPFRNMVNTKAKGLPVEWSIEQGAMKNIVWTADLGSKSYGGPIIAGGHVYVGTNNQSPRDPKTLDANKSPKDMGIFMAFDEKDGKYLWQAQYPKLAAGRVNDWPLEGLCSTPFVEEGKLYYVSNRCELICSDPDGKIAWKLDMIKDLGVFPHNISACSPLVVGNDVWLVTSNGVDEGHINVPAPKAPSFIKVNKTTGKVEWSNNDPTVKLTEAPQKGDSKEFIKQLVNKGELIQHGQWSNAAYASVNGEGQYVFPGGDGWIRSFDANGKLLWKFDCNPKDSQYELQGKGTRSDFIATPVIYDNKVFIGVGQDPEHETGVGHLWCIDMTKRGDVSPQLVTDGSVWPPKTKDNPDNATVWHYGGPAKMDAKKIGRNYYFGRTMSTCAIQDDLVYAAELSGWLHCLDAKTGKVYWEYDTKAPIWSSPYYADGKVYLGTDDGTVFVFEHGKEKKILAQNDMEGRVRATPVAANGMLFVMTENKLYAVAENKKK